MTSKNIEKSNLSQELNKSIEFKDVEIPVQFTHDKEFHDIYAKKLEQAGTWYESKDMNGKLLSRTWQPKTTYLVCPQNRQLVLNNYISINRIDILDPISDEEALELEQSTGGKIGILKTNEFDTSNILERMGIYKTEPKISKQTISESDI